jgi:hypothetical protein
MPPDTPDELIVRFGGRDRPEQATVSTDPIASDRGGHIMAGPIVVYLNADTLGKECFTYLDDEFGQREYDALAGAFRALGSQQTEKRFHKLTMEAGWEWVVTLDAPQAIECRMLDEPGIQHQIAVDIDAAKTPQPD